MVIIIITIIIVIFTQQTFTEHVPCAKPYR